jgi:hypothetical protein
MAWVKVVGAVGTFFVGSVVPLAWNYSESSRMARQVCLGSLSVPSPPSFEERFCQFPIKHVLDISRSAPDLFSGLVGVKSTGKTMTLCYLASQGKNCIYVQMRPGSDEDLDKILLARLQKSVITLPWFLDKLRLNWDQSARDRVEDVFQRVNKRTNEKVFAVIDLTDDSDKLVSVPFNARRFTCQIKHYVSDVRLIQCIFSASEGLMFQAESYREPRLHLFLSKELSLDLLFTYKVLFGQVERKFF